MKPRVGRDPRGPGSVVGWGASGRSGASFSVAVGGVSRAWVRQSVLRAGGVETAALSWCRQGRASCARATWVVVVNRLSCHACYSRGGVGGGGPAALSVYGLCCLPAAIMEAVMGAVQSTPPSVTQGVCRPCLCYPDMVMTWGGGIPWSWKTPRPVVVHIQFDVIERSNSPTLTWSKGEAIHGWRFHGGVHARPGGF